MAGLLDFANTDEGMQGLGLLAAAAPQMAPMNFAGRLAQAAQGYQGMKGEAMKRLEMEQQIQAKNIALQQQQQQWAMQSPLMQALSTKMMQKLQPSQQVPQSDSQQPSMPFSGAPRDMLSNDPVPQSQSQVPQSQSQVPQSQSQVPQLPQQPMQSQSGGTMLPNVPDEVAMWALGSGGMAAIPKLLEEYNKPTDMQKNNTILGIGIPEAAAAQRAKMAAEGLMSLKPEGTVYDPIARTGVFTAPDPKSASYTTWKDGLPSTAVIPGSQDVIRSTKRAETAGAGDVLPEKGVDLLGRPVFTNRTAAATGGATSAGATSNGRYPTQGATGTAPSGPIAPSLSASAQAAATQSGEGSGKQLVADRGAANGFSTRMYTLGQALDGLENAKVGPGSATANKVKSFLLAQTPLDMGKYLPGVDPKSIASYDEANKYLTQYAMGAVGSIGGDATDAKLAATVSGNASTSISKLASTDVVRATMGIEQMKNAQVRAFNASKLPEDQYQNFATQWNANVDPRVFVWNNTTPANRTKIAQTMTPDERTQFTQQYNAALKSGYIKGPK